MTSSITISDSSFQVEVIEARRPVLVDFNASWCAPCRMLAPILESLAEDFGERLTVATIDVDEHPAMAERYGVRGFPTLILFKNGSPVERLLGFMSKSRLVRAIEPHLESAVA